MKALIIIIILLLVAINKIDAVNLIKPEFLTLYKIHPTSAQKIN